VSSNRILTRLARDDFSLLEPSLEQVELPARLQLHPRNKPVEHVYFPESGIVSVVANGERALAIGIIGREGMTAVSIVMGNNDRPRHDTYVHVAGSGYRVSAEHMREALNSSVALREACLQYAHAFMMQTADTALSNGRHNIEERLARWLLLADDRLDNHEIPLTHEVLGVMIGTTRPGVTVALQELEDRGWIAMRRCLITVIDREGLIKSSNGAHVAQKENVTRAAPAHAYAD
jgi:CRP-like cAMP-binding protein